MTCNFCAVADRIHIINIGAQKSVSLDAATAFDAGIRRKLGPWTDTDCRENCIGFNGFAVVEYNAVAISCFVYVCCQWPEMEGSAFSSSAL